MREDQIPQVDALAQLYKECGEDIPIDGDARLAIVLWEQKVRSAVLATLPSPAEEPHRWKLPDERASRTHRFEIPSADPDKELKGYLTMGMYHDGALGEIFLKVSKQGSFVSGIMDAFVTTLSIGLQHGIPLTAFVKKFRHTLFEPSGMVIGAPKDLQGAYKSVLDYLFAFLSYRFPEGRGRWDDFT
jgi:ribonucleoside-diphosphate reductase alpha chain